MQLPSLSMIFMNLKPVLRKWSKSLMLNYHLKKSQHLDCQSSQLFTIMFPIHKWEWDDCPKGKKKNFKAPYPYLGSTSSFSTLIPRTTFSSRFYKIRATEFFRRHQKFGELNLGQLAKTAFNEPPKLFLEATGITISRSHGAQSIGRLQALWIRFSDCGLQFVVKASYILKNGLSKTLIFMSSHN